MPTYTIPIFFPANESQLRYSSHFGASHGKLACEREFVRHPAAHTTRFAQFMDQKRQRKNGLDFDHGVHHAYLFVVALAHEFCIQLSNFALGYASTQPMM